MSANEIDPEKKVNVVDLICKQLHENMTNFEFITYAKEDAAEAYKNLIGNYNIHKEYSDTKLKLDLPNEISDNMFSLAVGTSTYPKISQEYPDVNFKLTFPNQNEANLVCPVFGTSTYLNIPQEYPDANLKLNLKYENRENIAWSAVENRQFCNHSKNCQSQYGNSFRGTAYSDFGSKFSVNESTTNFLDIKPGIQNTGQNVFRDLLTQGSNLPNSNVQIAKNMELMPVDHTLKNRDPLSSIQDLSLIQNDTFLNGFQGHQIKKKTTGCVFCRNNGYHSSFIDSHSLKDENGKCICPVLRAYICPLCGSTGDFAHTIKYCPFNAVTKGDPVAAGLPPGKVINWNEVAGTMSNIQHNFRHSN